MTESVTPRRKPFFITPVSLLDDDDLTSTETLMVQAIAIHAWQDTARGCWPSNALLAKRCKLKYDGPDGGSKAVRKILVSLKAKGYVRVELFKPTRDNPTGRLLYLTPKATGDDPPPETALDPRACRPSPTRTKVAIPGPAGPDHPGLQALPHPGLQAPRIDSIQQTQGIDPSSEGEDPAPPPGEGEKTAVVEKQVGGGGGPDAAIVERLTRQARRTFADRDRARRVIQAIPGWLAWIEPKAKDPVELVAAAIAKGVKAESGKEVGFIGACLARAIDSPASKAPPVSVPPPAKATIRERDDDADATAIADEMARTLWMARTEMERDAIRREVERELPHLRRFRPMIEAACLDRVMQTA